MRLASIACGFALLLLLPVAGPLRAEQLPTQGAGIASLAELRERASIGDAEAQYDLAIALLCGNRVPRDPVEAARWAGLAAGQGHVAAQGLLGWMCMTGTGVEHDDRRAANWLLRAAEAENTAAQNNLGVLYALGRGVDADPAQAERWFGVAAEKGAADAVRNLDILHGREPANHDGPRAMRDGAHDALTGTYCRP